MSYSNGLLSDQSYQTANKYVQRGLPGVGFKLTDTGDYDMQNKKLVNVDEGENNQDVVNKHQLDVGLQTKPNKTDVLLLNGTSHMVGDLDLRGNKIILPGEIQMDRKLITNLDTDENQDLSAVNMITLKNKVEPKADKDYVDFEITKQNALINNTFVKKTGDQMNGDLILPHDSYPVDGNTNKAISYETQREIFLSRRESFPMQADINMNNNFIQNIAAPTLSHQATNKGYCDYNFLNRQSGGVLMGSLSMNQNDLFEIPAPKYESSAANKQYVDGEIGKIASVDTTQFIKKDGSVPMTGNLDMGGKKITGVGNPTASFHSTDAVNFRSMVETLRGLRLGLNMSFVHLDGSEAMTGNLDMGDHSIQKVGEPVNSDDVATKNYVDTEIGYISTPFLKLNGTRAMTGVLNMNDHKISNLKMPELNTDAANKQYIDHSHVSPSGQQTDVFRYLMEDADHSSSENNIVVTGIVDFAASPHEINKKAYEFTLVKDTDGSNDYRSRIGFNLYSLPLGYYTIIIEYMPPEMTNVIVTVQGTTISINSQTTKIFSNYTKTLVKFHNFTKTTPDYIFINLHGKTTSSTTGHLIVYGVKGYVSSVEPKIYDTVFSVYNGNMVMQTNIDLNNHKIINLANPTDDGDACNKHYVDIVDTKINDLSYYTKDHRYKTVFGEDFYDLIETSHFNLIQGVSGVVISGVLPNFILETDRFITDYNPKYGLKLSTKTHIQTADIFNQNSSFTFFMSFMHDNTKIGKISFSNTPALHIKFYPRYHITSNKLIIDYLRGS